jgi:hypothetical protein
MALFTGSYAVICRRRRRYNKKSSLIQLKTNVPDAATRKGYSSCYIFFCCRRRRF